MFLGFIHSVLYDIENDTYLKDAEHYFADNYFLCTAEEQENKDNLFYDNVENIVTNELLQVLPDPTDKAIQWQFGFGYGHKSGFLQYILDEPIKSLPTISLDLQGKKYSLIFVVKDHIYFQK